jgi:hypothetical protein
MELILYIICLPLETLSAFFIHQYEALFPLRAIYIVAPAVVISDAHLALKVIDLIQLKQIHVVVQMTRDGKTTANLMKDPLCVQLVCNV